MQYWYEDLEMSLQEIAYRLSSDAWQKHWIQWLGREYHPSQKIVNKVAKREGFLIRQTGARGKRNGNWNGGRVVDKSGYILVKVDSHPYMTKAGYVREHRLVAERILGRYLKATEVCHHIDENPANNSPDNLIVFETHAIHISQTMTGNVPSDRLDAAHREKMRLLEADPLLATRKANATRRTNRESGAETSKQKKARFQASHGIMLGDLSQTADTLSQ